MEQVLNKFKKAGMSINPDKCKFNCDVINYLDFQITKQGISSDPNLLKKIEQVVTPSNNKELEFEEGGLANFYCRYLLKYLELIELFNNLRKNNSEFKWTPKQSFQ